ncbi:sensor histidine kinase [Gordonia shandongensis]|uniref:sensor histidine kinase n=1 Tax=Gordonia shandongensis TaxID=376351 RepID=UPI0003F80E79|nr:histidine kinase [Gordonia shandongensis]
MIWIQRSRPDMPYAALVTVGVGVLLWACGVFTLVPALGGYSAPVTVLLLLVAFTLQLAALRYPASAFAAMAVLLVVDAPSGGSLPLWIAMSDIVFAAATAERPWLRRIVTGTGTGVSLGAAGVVGLLYDARAGVIVGLALAAFLVSPIGYAWAVVASRRAAAAERVAADAARATALAEERRRLSRELHDTVAGHVSAIAILAEAARDLPDPGEAIASMRANSLAALTELRDMIDLLAADDDEVRTARWVSLQPLIAAAEAVGGEVTITGRADIFPSRVEAVLTRIASEALANAASHAPGRDVTVDVVRDGDDAVLTVCNRRADGASGDAVGADGVGADGGRRQGVANMAVRAQSLGGTLSAGAAGDRWIVVARIPAGTGSAGTESVGPESVGPESAGSGSGYRWEAS